MKKLKKRSAFDKPIMPPVNPLISVDDTIKRLNGKLVDLKSGNYLIVIKQIKPFYRIWVSYEYYTEVVVHYVDLNNKDRMEGVMVPGMGNKPIELNKNKKLHTTSFVDWFQFEDQLLEVVSRWQTTINNEGHYGTKNVFDKRKQEIKNK